MGRPKIDEKPMATTTTTSPRSQTLPSSPTHSTLSSSSSEFEFMTLSLSPRTKSSSSATATATADDLFYKGQLLPLHLSPRLSMVRSLLLSSSSTSSSSTTTTATTRPSTSSSRPSSASDSTSSSARPSSATTIDDDELKRLNTTHHHQVHHHHNQIKKPNKYSSLSKKLSSVFRVKENKVRDPENSNLPAGSSVKRAKEVLRKYLKKVKPLYEKLSQKQKFTTNYSGNLCSLSSTNRSVKEREKEKESYNGSSLSHSFSGNLLYPRKKASVSSCPSSMRSSPNHSGILYRNGLPGMANMVRDSSSMEDLQSAIQGAIAHCKKSMVENKSMVSNEV